MMSTPEIEKLLAVARELRDMSAPETGRRGLSGRNVAVLGGSAETGGFAVFEQAATALGARVAHLRHDLSDTSTPEDIELTARLLGRLYDALDGVGLPGVLVGRIGAPAGVPVFDAICLPSQPLASLTSALDADGTSPTANRCALMQAVLLGALA